MFNISDHSQFFTTFIFGIFIGALIAEGALLVPYWRTLKAVEFYKLHASFGPRLYRFYAPLTILSTVLSITNAALSVYLSSPRAFIYSMAAICGISMVIIYFYYFQNANAQLAKKVFNDQALSIQLISWERWHWARVAVGLIGFANLTAACFIN